MRRFVTLFLSIAMMVVFFQCDELITNEEDPTEDDPNSELTDYSAEELADSASTILGETMTELMSGVSGDPTTMDLAGVESANQLFKSAIEKDPANSTANFGAALTELLMIMDAESDFMAEVTRWEAFLDTTNIFGEPYEDPGLGKMGPGGHSLVTKNPLALEPTPTLSGASYLKAVMSLPKYAQSNPQFSAWQTLIENEILAKVNYATAALALVEQDADFVFAITPEMQGNPEADTLEMDLTEVYLIDAILHGVSAVCNVAIAYDYNMNTYDSTAMKSMLAQDGSFMTIRDGKDTAMPTALTNIRSVIDKTEAALDFLESESDDQIDDLITTDLATAGEIDTVHMVLDSLQLAFDGPYDFALSSIFPAESGTIAKASTMPDVITVDLTALFDGTNGPMEPKSVLPAYTVEVGLDTSWEYQPETEVQLTEPEAATATLTFSGSGEYYFQFWKNYDPYWTEESGSDWNVDVPEFEEAVNWKMESLKTEYGDSLAYANVSVYWSYYIGENDPATGEPYQFPIEDTFSADVHVNFALQYPDWVDYYPILVWDAADYNTWVSGFDATFNGLFPDFTTTDIENLLLDMGIDATTWTQVFDMGASNGSY